MFLGIDFGTSAVKALLVDGEQQIVGVASVPLEVRYPTPGHCEQDPDAWWYAMLDAVDHLHQAHPAALSSVISIGLSGQMHGAVLLDDAGKALRPAILWNDVRASSECMVLETVFPTLRQVTGNIAMPGFTAPKLLWVREHEPDIFTRIKTVLLPKAYIRYRLTGEMIEEMSDASGTLWLDVSARDWSDEALGTTGLSRANMPRLVEGTATAGEIRSELAARWEMVRAPIVAGGAGDNAAGAVGLGVVRPGDAFLSLGTSGVLFAVTDRFRPWPSGAVHAFCHAIPDTWHQMGVTLSAAASLAWWATVAKTNEAELLTEMGNPDVPSPVMFLPYLGGERTPHNDGLLRSAFLGLSYQTGRAELTQAVLEGVAFSLRDCLDALTASGTRVDHAGVIGGGSRSSTWIRMIAAALNIPLQRFTAGEHYGAFGAARLARIAITGEAVSAVCIPPAEVESIVPDAALNHAYERRINQYRSHRNAGVILS